MWTLVFSLETEWLRDFTDCRDLKAVICVHMTTRAFQHIPAHLCCRFPRSSSLVLPLLSGTEFSLYLLFAKYGNL